MEKKADSARVVRLVTAMMPASVFSAGMTAFAMLMVMMIAADIGVIAKAVGKQRVHRCIRFAGNPAVELDARFRQSDLCAAADLFVVGFLRLAGAPAERMLLSAADAVVSAGDSHRLSVDEACRDFVPRAFVDFLNGRARNIHLRGALLMGLLFQIN